MWHLFITSKCIFEEKTLQCKEIYWIKEKVSSWRWFLAIFSWLPLFLGYNLIVQLRKMWKNKGWLAFLLSAKDNLRNLYVSHNFDIFRSGSLLQIISSIASLTGGKIVLSWIYELDGKVYKLWPKTFSSSTSSNFCWVGVLNGKLMVNILFIQKSYINRFSGTL